jgi:hypothetical protein
MNIHLVPMDFDALDPVVRNMPEMPKAEAAAWLANQPVVQDQIFKILYRKLLLNGKGWPSVTHVKGTPGSTPKRLAPAGRPPKVSNDQLMELFPRTPCDFTYFWEVCAVALKSQGGSFEMDKSTLCRALARLVRLGKLERSPGTGGYRRLD